MNHFQKKSKQKARKIDGLSEVVVGDQTTDLQIFDFSESFEKFGVTHACAMPAIWISIDFILAKVLGIPCRSVKSHASKNHQYFAFG
jgi:hypothetical protein